MLSTWKSQLQSFIRDDSVGRKEDEAGSDDPEVSRFRKALADLKGSAPKGSVTVEAAKPESPRAELERATTPEPAKTVPALPAAPQVIAPQNEEILAAARIISEQRRAAEALLREVCQLEERFKSEAGAAQAALDAKAAQAKATAAATLEQQAKALAQAAAQRYTAATTERNEADQLQAAARADAESANAAVASAEAALAELQQRLRDAKTAAEAKSTELVQSEALAKECVDKESAAASEEEQARERVAACQAAYVAAQKEAQTAAERADALKRELPEQSLAGIGELQSLAMKIAEEASTLGPQGVNLNTAP